MKKIEEPKPIDWDALCARPTLDNSELTGIVEAILEEVQKNGDRALQKLAEKYDGARLNDIQVCTEEISKAGSFVDSDLKKAIELAKANIEQFHSSQREDGGTSGRRGEQAENRWCLLPWDGDFGRASIGVAVATDLS